MLLRVRHVIQEAARQLGGSGNSNVECDGQARTEALEQINKATEILMMENPEAEATTAEIQLCVENSCFVLEEEFETILQARLNSRARIVRSDGFRYVESGPGQVTDADCAGAIENIGDGYPIHRELPHLMHVTVYSERAERDGEVVYVEGVDGRGGPVSEEIPLRHGNLGSVFSNNVFAKVTGLRKAPTRGRVFVHGWDPRNPQNMPWVTTMQTWSLSPAHRRYRIGGACPDYPVHLMARVSLRYHPVVGDDDVLLIQNSPAVTRMVRALAFLDREDMAGYLQYKNSAQSLLKKQSTGKHGVEKFALNMPASAGPWGGRRYGGRW